MTRPCKYYEADGITIWHADCRDVLPILGPVDHVITDPPYSERTHDGHNDQVKHLVEAGSSDMRTPIHYGALSPRDCLEYSRMCVGVCSGWIVWMTDHILAPDIAQHLEDCGRYVFAPLPFFAPSSRVRMAGDGPSSWTIWIIVARTAQQARWGTLPGGYVAQPGWNDKQWIGGKPTALMTALVRDYSRPSDLVCDPFMGAGTTLVAAKLLGRRAIGIDIDEEACEIAAKRLAQQVLPLHIIEPKAEQGVLV